MKHSGHRYGFLMFVLGLFSATQVRIVGSIGISELVLFIIGPFVYLSNVKMFRNDKCNTFIKWAFCAIIGCCICCWVNDVLWYNFLRGVATPYGYLASFIVFYPMLRRNPSSYSWYLLGACFSITISTFIFQGAYEMGEAEARGGGVEAIMTGAIFWISRVGPYVSWPAQAFYMHIPILYSIFAPAAFGLYALFSTASGRSSALMALAGAALIAYARKDVGRMRAIRKHVVLMALGALVFVAGFKVLYSRTASSGTLGEIARSKYETQTKGGTDTLSLLKGGRGELFLGLYYVSRRPVLGYGPWAIDWDGAYYEYLAKYGLPEDYREAMIYISENGMRPHLVGAHSAMLQFWLAYGILGVPVWIYLFYLIFDYFTKRIGGCPEFFGYFALTLPGALWSIFFTPFGNRLTWGLLVAMLLLNRVMTKEREQAAKWGIQ